MFHIQICHRQSFTHNFVTRHLSHTHTDTPSFAHTHMHHRPHTQSFVTHTTLQTHGSKLAILHLRCPSGYFRATSTTFSYNRKKLACGISRSCNSWFILHVCMWDSNLLFTFRQPACVLPSRRVLTTSLYNLVSVNLSLPPCLLSTCPYPFFCINLCLSLRAAWALYSWPGTLGDAAGH